jgi:hypothetical protein
MSDEGWLGHRSVPTQERGNEGKYGVREGKSLVRDGDVIVFIPACRP